MKKKKKSDYHWRKKCIICGRIQLMRKNQKTCSGKRFGWTCSRKAAIQNQDKEKRREIILKANRASLLAREKKRDEFINSLEGKDAKFIYELGYARGYDMGYYDKKRGEKFEIPENR